MTYTPERSSTGGKRGRIGSLPLQRQAIAASDVWSFGLLATYLLSLLYELLGSEDLPGEIRYGPLLFVLVIGLGSIQMTAVVRGGKLALDRAVLMPQALMLAAIFASTFTFYSQSESSLLPLSYAVGLTAHLVFQNHVFQLASARVLKAVLKFALVAVLLSLVAYRDVDYDGYLAGIFRTGNALGIVMCTTLYICYACWPERKPALIVGSAVIASVVFLTSSRSALAFLATFIGLHLASRWRSTRYLASVVLVVAVVLYFVYMRRMEDLYPEYLFGAKRLFDGATSRTVIWEASLEEIARNPWGVGLGLSENVMAPLVGQSGSHSAFLKMTLEGGWLFGTSYILLLVAMLRNSRLALTRTFLIALNVKYLFEIATPFGLSLSSALLTLPYFMEGALCGRASDDS